MAEWATAPVIPSGPPPRHSEWATTPVIPEWATTPVIPEWGNRESTLTFPAEAKVLKSKWIPAKGMRE